MRRILTKDEWRKRRQREKTVLIIVNLILTLAILVLALFIVYKVIHGDKPSDRGLIHDITDELLGSNQTGITAIDEVLSNGVEIDQALLTPNEYSRPQTPLKDIKSIVVHYTANPGTTAKNNRSYFNGLAKKHTTYASSHYIIGLEGEVIQCVPLNEIAFASNNRNNDSLSIECCHEDETGKFNSTTYSSLVALTAALCNEFNLGEEDIIRHYDVTKKRCPLYYVENEEEWYQFRKEVMSKVEEIKKSPS